MILNGEPCKKSGREVLREGMFENKNLNFPYKLCHSLRFIILRFIVLNPFSWSRQSVETYLEPASTSLFYDRCSTLSYLSALILLDLFIFICTPKFANTLRIL